ncbi:HOOK protein-domain-containing protein [Naematelia encephala]|uniref:HOOK protein-domain-containing protein n=1 Tax=Naematelia encephala TaxID=71784 RepID=A0A1Y2BLI2_9TREE|nr:HOOK protein-domain-containing protein [Naematelia encephala]
MSRLEQRALIAYVNSFKLPRRVTAFEQLSDGKALMEVMNSIDPTHFKSATTRSGPSTSSPSSDNWVLKMNTLKRLYRLLLSYPLPPPHPQTLAVTSLPDPAFSTIAKSPTTGDGLRGLAQICRMCLAVGVWANGNDKVIARIQQLEEGIMAGLMKSIEGVMSTLPASEEQEPSNESPEKTSAPLTPPPSDLVAERDRLLQENDELRARCEEMSQQFSDMSSKLDEVRERDEAIAGESSRLETPTAPSVLRSSQTATIEMDALRSDLARAEENLAHTEADLDKQTSVVSDLMRMVEDLKIKAAEAAKLKDQLDEYRHTAERLQKSENVIEKYKKKLEESAGLRRELRSLEQENAALVDANANLEVELRKSGTSRTLADSHKAQISILESKADQQAAEIVEMTAQLESARAQLADVIRAHEQDLEEIQIQQERTRELELSANGTHAVQRTDSSGDLLDGDTTLEDELEIDADGELEAGETKAHLRARIRALQRELTSAKSASDDSNKVTALETMLQEVTRSRDRYQADYVEAHRLSLTLQASLERIRSGKDGDSTQTAIALQQKLDEVIEEREVLLKSQTEAKAEIEQLEKSLRSAQRDLSLVDKDQQDMLAALKEDVQIQTKELDSQVLEFREQVATLKEKDRLHLEEVKRLLVEKADLQSAGIDQRDIALTREKQFGELRATLASSGVSADVQSQMIELHERNTRLSGEIRDLGDKLQRAKAFIRNQDALFRAEHTARASGGDFEEAQRSYEGQIETLKSDLHKARQNAEAIEKRYALEQQLMLSAWHDLGSRTVREHINAAGSAIRSRGAPKPLPNGWLGRQRRYMDEASFSR